MVVGAERFRCISVAWRGFPGAKNTSWPLIVCHTALYAMEALSTNTQQPHVSIWGSKYAVVPNKNMLLRCKKCSPFFE